MDENCNVARNSFLDQYDVSSESEDDIPELPSSPHHQSLTTVEDLLAGSDSDF